MVAGSNPAGVAISLIFFEKILSFDASTLRGKASCRADVLNWTFKSGTWKKPAKNKNRRPLQYRSTAVFLDRDSPEGQSVSDFPDSTFWPTMSGVIFVLRIMSTSSEPSSRD